MQDNNQQNQFQQPQYQQPTQYQQSVAPQPQKKKKAPMIIGIIAGVVVLVIIASMFASPSDDTKTTTKPQTVVAGEDSTEAQDDAIQAEDNEVKGEIGNYVCTIKSAEVCKNWEGKPAVKITYSFTNNNDEPESFDLALSDEIYQDGVQLETTFTDADEDDWGIDVKIKKGTTKEVTKVYELRDKKTPLEIEISEFISWSDDKLVYNVEL